MNSTPFELIHCCQCVSTNARKCINEYITCLIVKRISYDRMDEYSIFCRRNVGRLVI